MTELLYLANFNVEMCEAEVIAIDTLEDGRSDVILDKTCFYPRGGGQDWDKGEILSGNSYFDIDETRLDETGTVHHIGHFTSGMFNVRNQVSGKVDHDRRLINTRLHSAGHVIDMAINSLELDWIATKGQHYPDLSAVEYHGTWQPEQAEKLKSGIESRVNEFIRGATDNELRFMPVEEMHTICRHVPDNIPKNKPGRVVVYADNFGIPCGGTHVKNLQEIGLVKIPKLKEKKGVIRVTYTVDEIN
ncbi:hypothetical protein RAAC3_TM7C00001G0122 [Candidatus Saccharibacteria bacterium RAAC3_TM7_1]|nr:hypothetical protein RAAC3_TM7C00001G0122 [Candidatus Saccharibacteria bacterium RAAC3_TM7_1]